MSFSRPTKKRLTTPAIAILLVIIAVGIGLVYALITQQVPSVTIPANGPQTVANCSSVMNETNPSPVQGAILFGCGAAPGTPAFVVNYPSQNVPTFALAHPSSGGTVFLHYVAASAQCTVTLNSGNMTTGTNIVFSTSGPFYYCETYYGYPLVGVVQGSFTVTWSP